jgi:hypothetical protein
MSGQLMNSQLAAAEFSNLQQSLVKVADVLANSVTTSQVLVEEMRNMREAVAGDMRFEMQQALREHDAERANSSEETRANKAKS